MKETSYKERNVGRKIHVPANYFINNKKNGISKIISYEEDKKYDK
jgi:hypothetical protein